MELLAQGYLRIDQIVATLLDNALLHVLTWVEVVFTVVEPLVVVRMVHRVLNLAVPEALLTLFGRFFGLEHEILGDEVI